MQINIPQKPNRPPPKITVNSIQNPLMPIELPTIFGVKILFSICCPAIMTPIAIRVFTVPYSAKTVRAIGTPLMNEPKMGIRFDIATITPKNIG